MAFISTDRFGNKYATVSLLDKKNTGYGYGYVEIGNKVFKVEHSPSSSGKEYKGVEVTGYVKLTEARKNQNGFKKGEKRSL